MWHGEAAKVQILPFLQLGHHQRERTEKFDPKGAGCLLWGPAPITPRRTLGVFDEQGRAVIINWDITWWDVMSSPVDSPPQEKPGGEGNKEGDLKFEFSPGVGAKGAGERRCFVGIGGMRPIREHRQDVESERSSYRGVRDSVDRES